MGLASDPARACTDSMRSPKKGRSASRSGHSRFWRLPKARLSNRIGTMPTTVGVDRSTTKTDSPLGAVPLIVAPSTGPANFFSSSPLHRQESLTSNDLSSSYLCLEKLANKATWLSYCLRPVVRLFIIGLLLTPNISLFLAHRLLIRRGFYGQFPVLGGISL
jgi:hypothetical protein